MSFFESKEKKQARLYREKMDRYDQSMRLRNQLDIEKAEADTQKAEAMVEYARQRRLQSQEEHERKMAEMMQHRGESLEAYNIRMEKHYKNKRFKYKAWGFALWSFLFVLPAIVTFNDNLSLVNVLLTFTVIYLTIIFIIINFVKPTIKHIGVYLLVFCAGLIVLTLCRKQIFGYDKRDKTEVTELIKEAIKNEDLDQALTIYHERRCPIDKELLLDALIKKNEFDKCDDFFTSGLHQEEIYEFLCKCARQMKKSGYDKDEVMLLIDDKIDKFYIKIKSEPDYEWNPNKVKNRIHQRIEKLYEIGL